MDQTALTDCLRLGLGVGFGKVMDKFGAEQAVVKGIELMEGRVSGRIRALPRRIGFHAIN